ncbi:MAG: lipid-A-disaccharide synthase [Hyphomicrobiales bacterium]
MGDQLGARLMAALKDRLGDEVRFSGVGGERMAREGLQSIFPLSDIAVGGITAVLARLPLIIRRIRETTAAALAAAPDVLVAIDSPEFTHNVAKRVRKANPAIPVVDYVSPSVWAWRPGRARKMAAYVDHLLAILPFEPEVHRRLAGPACTYVGHPLIERLDVLRPASGERPDLAAPGARPTLLVLPGSRHGEVKRLMAPIGETLRLLVGRGLDFELLLPAVTHLRAEIEAAAADWPVQPTILAGEEAKFGAFRRAHAALAASGTVTLELAIAGVPMVVMYKLDPIARRLKWLGSVPSIVLPNLILGENVIPEFLDEHCEPKVLAERLAPLLSETPDRAVQVAGLARLDEAMRLEGDEAPGRRAARIVLEVAGAGETAGEGGSR